MITKINIVRFAKKFVYENCYFDKSFDREVWFGDIILKDKPVYKYYLFYDIGGGHTFHTPIEDAFEYKDLEIVEVDKLYTEGNNVINLVSNQFVRKLITLLESEDFSLSGFQPNELNITDKKEESMV